MNGGLSFYEYVMSVYRGSDASSTQGASSYSKFGNATGFSSALPSKYYDEYTSATISEACNGGICYGHVLSEILGWYSSNFSDYVNSYYPWFFRNMGNIQFEHRERQ